MNFYKLFIKKHYNNNYYLYILKYKNKIIKKIFLKYNRGRAYYYYFGYMVHIASFGSVFAPKIEKNIVLGVIDNLSLRKSKKILFVSEFDETFLGH